jgi:uncharacterized protein (DUF58 family)
MKLKRLLKPGFLIAMGVVLYLIAANSGTGWMYVVAATLAATVLVSIPAPLLNVRGLEIERRAPATGTAGEPLEGKIEVRNEGRFAKHLLEVRDDFAGGTGNVVMPRIKGGASEEVGYTVENPRRGVYSGGEIILESGAPFGLFYGRCRVQARSETVIYPRTFQVAGISDLVSPESAFAEQDESDALRRGAGGEFWGVREYRPGDPAKLVAWRRSARNLSTGRLAVLEMADETNPPLSLALNLDHRAPQEAREMQVSAAASILLQALREGRKVVADAGPQRADLPENPDSDGLLTWCASLQASRLPELDTAAVEIVPSVKDVRPSNAGTVVLVSCREFAGPGPWMTAEEERQFAGKIEAEGRRVVVLGPDVREPWRVA